MMQALFPAIWLAVGAVAGAAYFTSIWWSAQRFATGTGIMATLGLSALRLALLGGLLVLASWQGAAPLLTTALGVVVARFGVMRRFREARS